LVVDLATLKPFAKGKQKKVLNPDGTNTLVLASASPRRLSILGQVGIEPDTLRPTSIDETPKKNEPPRAYVSRVAKEKAQTALKSIDEDPDFVGSFILSADTIVAVGRRILIKPELVEEAARMLQLLSGRSHRVYTAVCLITPNRKLRHRIIETRVRFKHLSPEEIDCYLVSNEWRGKAGGYAIQGMAGAFVERLVGSYTNVVGLPLTEVINMLRGEGYPVTYHWMKRAGRDLE
jgi:septum formation protein